MAGRRTTQRRIIRASKILVRVTVLLCLVFMFGRSVATTKAIDQAAAEQRTQLLTRAVKVQNNSLRYLHSTWFRSQCRYQMSQVPEGLTKRRGLPSGVAAEVLIPPGGFEGPYGAEIPTRSQASALYATALALHNNTFNEQRVGISREEAHRRCAAWANGMALSYWQDSWLKGWQSALWVYYMSYGAHLVWDSIPGATRELIDAAVESEADRLLAVPPPFYLDGSGKVLHKGDSKSEENGWNGAFLLMAAREYPNHPNAWAWEKQARNYMITALATPDQVGTDPRIKGSNLNPDGTVTNHGRINPDYMMSASEMAMRSDLVSADASMTAPEEAHNNLPLMWSGLTELQFDPAKGFKQPGGTIYRFDSEGKATANMYYPLGPDWSSLRRFNAAEMDAEIWAVTREPLALEFALRHLDFTLALQARHKDGRTFARKETAFPEEEQFVAATSAEIVARILHLKTP